LEQSVVYLPEAPNQVEARTVAYSAVYLEVVPMVAAFLVVFLEEEDLLRRLNNPNMDKPEAKFHNPSVLVLKTHPLE